MKNNSIIPKVLGFFVIGLVLSVSANVWAGTGEASETTEIVAGTGETSDMELSLEDTHQLDPLALGEVDAI